MPLPHSTLLLRLALACLLGAALGYERDRHRRNAGLRTHMLVSLAAAAFMIVSTQFPYYHPFGDQKLIQVDASRIASNIVSGAGFLAGGAILRTGLTVRGLTTAAGLWLVTAIGTASGAGMLIEASALSALGVFSLWGLRSLSKSGHHHQGTIVLSIAGQPSLAELIAAMEQLGAQVIRHDYRVQVERTPRVVLKLAIRHPKDFSPDAVVERMRSWPGIRGVRIERMA